MKMSKRTGVNSLPFSEWGDPGLPDARTAMYRMIKGERRVLYQEPGYLTDWHARNSVRNKARLMAIRLGLAASISWVGSVRRDDDGNHDRNVWLATRKD
jgi:hypothetical protein